MTLTKQLLLCSLLSTAVGVVCAQAQSIPATPQPTRNSNSIQGKDYDDPPKILKSVDPEYTDRAQQHRIRGGVELRIHVTATGTVDSAIVTKGLGYGLDDKAVVAALQYRFAPARKGGVPVDCVLDIEIQFQPL